MRRQLVASRRVRQVGRVRFVRLTTGERVSQCGRFFVRAPALTPGKHWRVWLRLDPHEGPGWRFPLYDASRLQDALQAVAVFVDRVASLKPRGAFLDELTATDRAAYFRDVRRIGLEAIASAEQCGELGRPPKPVRLHAEHPRQTRVRAT